VGYAEQFIESVADINLHWPLKYLRWKMAVVGAHALFCIPTTMANIATTGLVLMLME